MKYAAFYPGDVAGTRLEATGEQRRPVVRAEPLARHRAAFRLLARHA